MTVISCVPAAVPSVTHNSRGRRRVKAAEQDLAIEDREVAGSDP